MKKKTAAVLLLILLCACAAAFAGSVPEARENAWDVPEGYQVERVVILARHNIRSPLSDADSMLGKIVPHPWFEWSSASGDLSVRGGLLETAAGQFYRKWAESTGLFPENWQPDPFSVRFYANAYQRTQATARFFATGLLPMADVAVEQHAKLNTMDEVFKPRLRFCNGLYPADVMEQIAETGGPDGMEGIRDSLRDSVSLLMEVTDMAESEAYRSGEYGDLLEDGLEIVLKEKSSPEMKGWLKTATSVADALIMQYYEEPDSVKAAFGHELTFEQWRMISGIVTRYGEILYGTPLIAVNAAHPMLEALRGELTANGRKFSFICGHDSNLASVISCLDVRDYTLPEAVEAKTPVGAKLTFIRLTDENGDAWYDVSLVYQSVRQMHGTEMLDAGNPPLKVALELNGIPANELGLVSEKDLLDLLDEKAEALYRLKEYYSGETAPENAGGF